MWSASKRREKHIARGLHFHFGGTPLALDYQLFVQSKPGYDSMNDVVPSFTSFYQKCSARREGSLAMLSATWRAPPAMRSHGSCCYTSTSGGSLSPSHRISRPYRDRHFGRCQPTLHCDVDVP